MGRFNSLGTSRASLRALKRLQTPTFTISGLTASEMELIRVLIRGESESDICTFKPREVQEMTISILRKMGDA